jgi:hypothetical protein
MMAALIRLVLSVLALVAAISLSGAQDLPQNITDIVSNSTDIPSDGSDLHPHTEIVIDFDAARNAVYNLTNLISQRFEFHKKKQYQFFLGSMNLSNRTWEMLKYKFCFKMLASNSSTHHHIKGKNDLVMIFGGSSVTAGHDNYFNQSYPLVFERRMKSAFEAAGVNLIVRNIAMGPNPCRPSEYCYNTNGDDHADWIGWEQSYNCVKDRGAHELIARIAYFNRAVVHYTASGAFLPNSCNKSTVSCGNFQSV